MVLQLFFELLHSLLKLEDDLIFLREFELQVGYLLIFYQLLHRAALMTLNLDIFLVSAAVKETVFFEQ